jgi:hypothetical protein
MPGCSLESRHGLTSDFARSTEQLAERFRVGEPASDRHGTPWASRRVSSSLVQREPRLAISLSCEHQRPSWPDALRAGLPATPARLSASDGPRCPRLPGGRVRRHGPQSVRARPLVPGPTWRGQAWPPAVGRPVRPCQRSLFVALHTFFTIAARGRAHRGTLCRISKIRAIARYAQSRSCPAVTLPTGTREIACGGGTILAAPSARRDRRCRKRPGPNPQRHTVLTCMSGYFAQSFTYVAPVGAPFLL